VIRPTTKPAMHYTLVSKRGLGPYQPWPPRVAAKCSYNF